MKDFLLIANKNCATYKEVFPLFKDGIVSFGSPVKEYEGTDKKFGNHGWITTLTVPHQKKLVLTATYDPELYPKYDNYNAIEVSRVKDIPYNYDGVMGVPITFLDQYNPEQFEIVGGTGTFELTRELGVLPISKGFISDYERCGGQRAMTSDTPLLAFYTPSGKAIIPYARILIRRKK